EKDLLPSFTGNVGIGVYLDSFALIDALLGEQVASLDRSGILAVAELQPGKGQALASAIDARVRPDRRFRVPSGATLWKLGEIGWLDVRGVARSIQAAAQEHGGILGAGTRLVADRFGSVRDILFEARPAPDGVQAQLYVRFGPARSGGRGGERGQGR